MLKRFFNDLKKYNGYALRSAKSQLKAEVANSYLNYLWWILDPLCFMLIYTVVFGYIFNAREQYMPTFIFIGITMWDFFSKSINGSVKMVKSNKAIVSKVYIPKFVLLITRMYVNGFKMMISFGIVVLMMIVQRIPVTFNVFWVIPILIVEIMFTFGLGTIVMHFGVFVEDLSNVVTIVLRLVFYATGIFYKVDKRIGGIAGKILLRINPMALCLTDMRRCLIYSQGVHARFLIVWACISVILIMIGVRTIYKNENSYVKVI